MSSPLLLILAVFEIEDGEGGGFRVVLALFLKTIFFFLLMLVVRSCSEQGTDHDESEAAL